ncbi:MAG: hypothetical protein U1E65_21735 [Myxococcota bacterium]
MSSAWLIAFWAPISRWRALCVAAGSRSRFRRRNCAATRRSRGVPVAFFAAGFAFFAAGFAFFAITMARD